ncbi:hypothetical protein BGZ89_005261 [Linnemannia elongata]|nr:hypothetical protein BGZ89_005261 [Linnemannia elongata]
MAVTIRSGIRSGQNHGHITTVRELKTPMSYKKGVGASKERRMVSIDGSMDEFEGGYMWWIHDEMVGWEETEFGIRIGIHLVASLQEYNPTATLLPITYLLSREESSTLHLQLVV